MKCKAERFEIQKQKQIDFLNSKYFREVIQYSIFHFGFLCLTHPTNQSCRSSQVKVRDHLDRLLAVGFAENNFSKSVKQ